MANQYEYGAPPSYGNQGDYGKNSSDYSPGGGNNYNNRGGGNNYNKSGNYGGNKGGFKGGEVVTQEDTIFVSGMAHEVTENEINAHFGSIGIIKKDRRTQKPKIWIYRNKETGVGKGECTITYDDPSAASSAIDWFDGKNFNGNVIKVSLAQRNNTWQQKGGVRRGGFGGGNRGGFGGGNDDRQGRNNDDRSPRNFSGSGASGGGGQSRDGDWICSGCQNKNFAWRNECNRCKEPKSDDGSGSSGNRGSSQRGGFQNRDNRSGGGSYNRGNGGSFNRGGPMRGPGGNDRSGGSGYRQRPY